MTKIFCKEVNLCNECPNIYFDNILAEWKCILVNDKNKVIMWEGYEIDYTIPYWCQLKNK